MRASLLLASLISTAAFAQYDNGGVWTGYVGGWKPHPPPATVATPILGVNAFVGPGSRARAPQRQVVVVPYFVATNAVATNQQQESQRAAEQAEQRRAWEAEQNRLAQQTQLENERRLAAEREAMLQQQLEAERRLTAEKEALAAEKLRLEREQAARMLAAIPPPALKEPARAPEQPRTPGNDIYEWTDADGVVHFSTNVPASAKGTARKVGGRQ